MAVMGGWETLTRNGGSQEWEGVDFIMGGGVGGGLEIFKVSLHSWQRGAGSFIL